MSNTTHYDINFNAVTRASGQGNREASLHNLIRGKNWLGGPANVPALKENVGLVFLAPPDLHLHPANVGHIREFVPLLSEDPYSLGSTIRDMLDPRGAWASPNSRLNNPLNPFCSLLDNTVISLDGWPDYVMEEYVSNPGKAGSTIITAKGRIKKNQYFPLNVVHQNLPGDAINQIYTYLALWQDHVHRWSSSPHLINVRHNRLDYAQRWYRFAFDSSGTRINQFTMSGYGFAKAGSQGAVMDYNTESSVNGGYETISAQWSNVGVFHNDPIVLLCFNRLVERFNPAMRDGMREEYMVRVGAEENVPSLVKASPFQYYGYPRINLRTLEFEIWLEKPIYNFLKQGFMKDEVLLDIARNRDENFNSNFQELPKEVIDAIVA